MTSPRESPGCMCSIHLEDTKAGSRSVVFQFAINRFVQTRHEVHRNFRNSISISRLPPECHKVHICPPRITVCEICGHQGQREDDVFFFYCNNNNNNNKKPFLQRQIRKINGEEYFSRFLTSMWIINVFRLLNGNISPHWNIDRLEGEGELYWSMWLLSVRIVHSSCLISCIWMISVLLLFNGEYLKIIIDWIIIEWYE